VELSFFHFFIFPSEKRGKGKGKGNKKDIVWLDWIRLKGFGMPMQWNDQADARVCFPPENPRLFVAVFVLGFSFILLPGGNCSCVVYCAWHTHPLH